jgi:type I pantothenate kinase
VPDTPRDTPEAAAPPAQRPVVSPYVDFSREAWAHLRDSTPLTLSEADLAGLRGINERLSLDEVAEVYLPLSRLLNLYVAATKTRHDATATFLQTRAGRTPYIIGIGGSVAAGKSTTARVVQALLSRWPEHPNVELVTTDGFLFPNAVLESRGLMRRKGFPDSYDTRRLLEFVAAVKAGNPAVAAPVYSHLAYDIIPGAEQVVREPDVLILEGLNVLQVGGMDGTRPPSSSPRVMVSDYFDFSIYVDAEEHELETWYVQRFLRLRETAFRDPSSYFQAYSRLDEPAAIDVARGIWRDINLVNLRENIAPTRGRAHLVLEKGPDHRVQRVRLKKL